MAVIIYPPTIDWNWMVQRPQQIMKQFALDGHKVYYCNKKQIQDTIFTETMSNLFIVHNNKQFIKSIIPDLKKHEEKIIVWFSWPKLYPFIKQYFPDYVVFDYVDDIPSWDKYVSGAVNQANIIFTTAKSLQENIEKNFPRKESYLIQNGCDIEHFQKSSKNLPDKPKEFKNHNGPIIGYIGAWAPWIDESLVNEIAKTFPNAIISIIGAEFGKKFVNFNNNVIFLGYKPYQLLPSYLYYYDICIIPFTVNQITKATNPIKMYEYLAAGKPVVTTNLPEVANIPNVYVSKNHQEFINHISIILNSNSTINKEVLNTWLNNNSWKERYENIKSKLSTYHNEFINYTD